ncbi:unnamed protein product [Brassica rapa subsp. trilocularis]|uniref:(rape) hypothetical protein n=1 Tax=Brassica napus TaxID=3708 RepID=A0A078F2Q7_BRANA|nr:unnamed protein product [Brassica napus]CDY07656.1 BnaA03g18550D [Brassica napus]
MIEGWGNMRKLNIAVWGSCLTSFDNYHYRVEYNTNLLSFSRI